MMLDFVDQYTTEKERWWLGVLISLNIFLWCIFKNVKGAKGKEMVLAYPIVSFVITFQFVRIGWTAVFDGSMMGLSTDPYTRLKADHEGFAQLAQLNFAYEVYNTMSAIVLPQYRTPAFLGHHIFTMIIAKCSQNHGPEFYGLFYLGIASTSNLCLAFVDFFRHGPKVFAETFPTVNFVARVAFAVLFLIIRAATWPLVSLVFWHDTITMLMHPPEDGGTWRAYLFFLLVANTFLGGLQVAWAGHICTSLVEVIKGPDKNTKAKKKLL